MYGIVLHPISLRAYVLKNYESSGLKLLVNLQKTICAWEEPIYGTGVL